MFAVSQVDSQKMGRFVESVNVAFEYKGVFPNSSSHPIQGAEAGATPSGRPSIVPQKISVAPGVTLSRKGSDLRKNLQKMLKGTPAVLKVKIRQDIRGVTVSLSEAGFFDPGSAKVRPDSLETLRTIGEMLKDTSSPIVVEGHTDNTPIKTAVFPSNWELSTARATSIVSYLIEELRYDPERLAAAGYAEYRPIADNATPEGRGQNRRVDLVVLTEGSGGAPSSVNGYSGPDPAWR